MACPYSWVIVAATKAPRVQQQSDQKQHDADAGREDDGGLAQRVVATITSQHGRNHIRHVDFVFRFFDVGRIRITMHRGVFVAEMRHVDGTQDQCNTSDDDDDQRHDFELGIFRFPASQGKRTEHQNGRDPSTDGRFREGDIGRVQDQHPTCAQETINASQHDGGPKISHARDGYRRRGQQRQERNVNQQHEIKRHRGCSSLFEMCFQPLWFDALGTGGLRERMAGRRAGNQKED